MINFRKTEIIEILMLIYYKDRQRSHQDVCYLFNNVQPKKNPVDQFTLSKLVKIFKDLGSGRPKSTNEGQIHHAVLVSVMDNSPT